MKNEYTISEIICNIIIAATITGVVLVSGGCNKVISEEITDYSQHTGEIYCNESKSITVVRSYNEIDKNTERGNFTEYYGVFESDARDKIRIQSEDTIIFLIFAGNDQYYNKMYRAVIRDEINNVDKVEFVKYCP